MLEGSGRLSEEATDTSPRGAEAGGRMGGRIAEELLIGKKKKQLRSFRTIFIVTK